MLTLKLPLMKKNLLSGIFTLFCFTCTFAQSSDYFEVYTKPAHPRAGGGFTLNRDSILSRIQNIPDTTSTFATFVISVDNPADIDSLFFALSNSQSQNVYSGALQYSSLVSNSGFKISGNTIYVTVGPYPYLKRFTATAQVKHSDGSTSALRSFAKN